MVSIKFLRFISANRKFYFEPVAHHVESESPNSKSWAAAILLKRQYSEPQEKAAVAEFKTRFNTYVKFRKSLLKQEEQNKGQLSCYHCGNYPLRKKSDKPKELATLDHIIPVSKGGDQFDRDNIVISCAPCNGMRGNKDLKSFRPKRTEFNLKSKAGKLAA
jgi:5-methylcytosine-specific restriction endonuclease McrA